MRAGTLHRQQRSSGSVVSDMAADAGRGGMSPTEALARLPRTASADSLLARSAHSAGMLQLCCMSWHAHSPCCGVATCTLTEGKVCQSSLGQAALSCLCRLSLHALVFGNLRAVAFLWGRFVRELRFSHWETLTPLPRMPGGAVIAAYTRFQFGHLKGVGLMTPTQLV